jgi:hypothetical protein
MFVCPSKLSFRSISFSSMIERAAFLIAFEPLLELGPSPLLSGLLPKANARSAPILVDEVDAGGFIALEVRPRSRSMPGALPMRHATATLIID